MTEDMLGADICRVCRSEGLADRPLFHPCICTGSIKWIHQECLVQWMRYSRKEYCELCGYRFSFTPIYSPDMPRRLPLKDVLYGLFSSIMTAVKYWIHYTLVAIAWLGVVPITACRTYRILFNDSLDIAWKVMLDVFSLENLSSDVFHGCFVVTCTLVAFIGLVWLREQIIHVGGPEWFERDNLFLPNQLQVNDAPQAEEQNNQRRNVGDNNNVPPFVVDEPPRVEANGVQEDEPRFRDGEVQRANEVEAENQANAGIWRGQAQGGEAPGEAEEANWNPMAWDRPAEELTWARLLGLDGSLLFLEHVFWVILLNTLFIVVFAYCPYHIGRLTVIGLGIEEYVSASHFEGLVTTLCGYCIIGILLMTFHTLAAIIGFQKCRKILGICYIVVKVSLLAVVEIGGLPLVCGWWLDICSLPLFDATFRDRENSFKAAPGTSMFIHWLAGMVYVYYFASFVLLLREVLRPGVIWFLRNITNPDLSPIQEMIHLPILKHIRRLTVSPVFCGTLILLTLWLPIKILKWAWPGHLPYTVTLQSETQVSYLSLEILLLQVILPALLEQSYSRTWLKNVLLAWLGFVAWMLNLRSYLLKEPIAEPGPAIAEEPQHADIGAAHHARLFREGSIDFQPYVRPPWFAARLVGLFICVCISLVISSLIVMTLPVWIGRKMMIFWLKSVTSLTTQIIPPNTFTNDVKDVESLASGIHEVYTFACGTYICWAAIRILILASSWLPRGRRVILENIKYWSVVGMKATIAFVLLIVVIPLLFGLLVELVLVVPIRVPLEQNPIIFLWQNWALGVLYTKIAMVMTMMGPEQRLRTAIERVFNDGIREMDLKFVITDLAAPVICCFGLALSIPYVIAHGIVPLAVTNLHAQILIARRLYPALLLLYILYILISFEIRQFKKLYEHIRNDKYLVGQRLVNYEHRVKTQQQQQQQAAKSS